MGKKPMTKRLSNFISTIVITALLLTGAVPYFAWDQALAAEETDAQEQTGAQKQTQDYGLDEDDEMIMIETSESEEESSDASAESSDSEEKNEAATGTAAEASGKTAETVLPAIRIDDSDVPKTYGTSVILMDMETGTVLYEKNADKVRQPASVTKILTCLVALENLPLDKEVTVQDDVEMGGSTMGLMPGEKLTVEELLYGLMLPSGNDAAEVLAVACAGSIDEFGEMMNKRAKKIGAEHTDFRNPNGLNEDPERLNYTTARDLALISREAMNNPQFRKIVGTAKHTVPATNLSDKRKLENSNFCLWDKSKVTIGNKKVPYKYEGCTGIKTGYTSDAGNCFVGSAERDGTEILMVSLNSEKLSQRYKDGINLWNYGLEKYETYHVLSGGKEAGVCRVWHGKNRTVALGTDQDLGVTINKGTAKEQDFTTEFRLDDDHVKAPVKAGQKMGRALVFNGKGRLVGAEDLYALGSVEVGGPLSYIGIADEDLPLAGGIAGAVLLLIIIICSVRSARKRRARRKQQEEIRGELATMRTAGVGMTATEINELTGREEIKPIQKGPDRISDEELTAWTSTAAGGQGNYTGSRFGGKTPRGGYSREAQKRAFAEAENQPVDGKSSLSDEELFALLESGQTTDMDAPRRHGKLTDEEMQQVMNGEPGQSEAGSETAES